MFIPIIELAQDYNVKPRNILHVGAHLGEESQSYDKYFNVPVLWIEAQPQLCSELKKRLNSSTNTIIEACVSDKDNEKVSFNFSSNSQSSSMLNFGTHSVNYPDVFVTESIIINTKRLETILQGRQIPDFVNLDIQGVELRAIKSLGNLIKQVDAIYTEVNNKEVYESCDLIGEVDSFLIEKGFRRVATRWELEAGWGDALYVNDNVKRRSIRQFIRSKFKEYLFYIPQIKNKIKLWIS
jgi:FkbM family methyltransferase